MYSCTVSQFTVGIRRALSSIKHRSSLRCHFLNESLLLKPYILHIGIWAVSSPGHGVLCERYVLRWWCEALPLLRFHPVQSSRMRTAFVARSLFHSSIRLHTSVHVALNDVGLGFSVESASSYLPGVLSSLPVLESSLAVCLASWQVDRCDQWTANGWWPVEASAAYGSHTFFQRWGIGF